MGDTVRYEQVDATAIISLNRPDSLNGFTTELCEDLLLAFEKAGSDESVRVIILTGEGKAFCAGADLKERSQGTTPESAKRNVETIQRVTRAMVFGDRLIIGAINGWAVGGGFEWALGCDLALWAQSARAFFPEVDWGLFVTGGATAILPALIGPAKTKEMMLLGQRYSADELHALGVAWRVVPDAELMRQAQAVAARIASLPPRSVRDMKTVLNKATYADVATALELETEAAIRASLDPDTAGRIRAFSER